jgi:elongation factor G
MQRVGRLLRMHANRQENIDKAEAGDIVAVVGLSDTRTGDTLCDKTKPIILESIEFPAPVISISIKPEGRADNDKMGEALHRLADEDPTFIVHFDDETEETIISGMGELHLEVLVERLRREFSVPATSGVRKWLTARPRRSLPKATTSTRNRPVVAASTDTATCAWNLWTGRGFRVYQRGQGRQHPLRVHPGGREGRYQGDGERTVCRISGGRYAWCRVRRFLHDVDSSEFAFIEAARVCFRNLFLKGSHSLLEPVMSVEVISAPEEYMGGVTGSICSRRGRIESMDDLHGMKVVRGMVPLSEMFGYSNDLRTMTSGRGSFTMHFERYETVPFSIAEEIIKKRREANKIR